MKDTWITVKQASEILECSVQNIHYLVKGRHRKHAKRKKIIPPILHSVKIIKRGTQMTTYLISLQELTNYLNTNGDKK
jgi:hypothetical protein